MRVPGVWDRQSAYPTVDMPCNSDIDDIAAEIGFTPALTIAVWYGGRRLYVPKQPIPGHALEGLVGRSAFVRLVSAFPGKWLRPPSERWLRLLFRDRRVADAISAGRSNAVIAADEGVTYQRIAQIRSALCENGLIDYSQLPDEQS